MQKILIAVDGSDTSHRAAERLVKMIAWLKAPPEVHVLTVHLAVPYGGRIGAVIGKEQLQKYYAEEEAEAMKDACAVLDAAGIPYRKHTAVGDIAQEIVKTAKSLGADLVCMGTHGRGKVGTMVLGSIAQKVISQSTLPVLLVP